ncbi:CYFA0S02e00782g1_1 [Cyberlindnera fabianii]|uniref:CYFA0S02e00782g1_1 n=1 Tax=Cyberlindnera fabianii TaxID=36022 RepID=A0A061ALD6_CYBFA|nr:Protein SRN2 [Cyberlindnera fabianii]CDR38364.1 CYFA0S02e00782g1_1 [Cyberlindnera fabianii]
MSTTPPTLPPKGPLSSTPADSSVGGDSTPVSQTPTPHQHERRHIPLPQVCKTLPTHEITKLLDTLDVLKGYLITLMKDQVENEAKELDAVVKQIETYIESLHKLNSQKDETNKRLEHMHSLVQKWTATEAQMARSLQKFSRENIYTQLLSSVNDSRRLTESIQDSFLSHTVDHDEAVILEFIRNYKQERTLYYLRKEKLSRFNENRVGGLS